MKKLRLTLIILLFLGCSQDDSYRKVTLESYGISFEIPKEWKQESDDLIQEAAAELLNKKTSKAIKASIKHMVFNAGNLEEVNANNVMMEYISIHYRQRKKAASELSIIRDVTEKLGAFKDFKQESLKLSTFVRNPIGFESCKLKPFVKNDLLTPDGTVTQFHTILFYDDGMFLIQLLTETPQDLDTIKHILNSFELTQN